MLGRLYLDVVSLDRGGMLMLFLIIGSGTGLGIGR